MLRRFVQSYVQATRRALAWNLQELSPPAEQILFRFSTRKDVNQWDVYSDMLHGGSSRATLEPSEDNEDAGVFRGSLSTELNDNAPVRLKRSGFIGMRTREDKHNLDLEPFDTLVFKVKGDGRVYITSLRTENWVMGPADDARFNQWQAFLFAPKDEWCTVKVYCISIPGLTCLECEAIQHIIDGLYLIPFNRYIPTWRGKILNANHEMNLARITGVGISTTVEVGPQGAVTGPGEFRLELEWIKAIRSES